MDKKQPKVINKSGTTRLTDEAAAAREAKAQNEFRGRRRDNRRGRRAAEEGKKEFDSVPSRDYARRRNRHKHVAENGCRRRYRWSGFHSNTTSPPSD